MSEIDTYRQAVAAIKAGDEKTGRKLLVKTLRADDSHEMAWVWLARITEDEEKKLEYVDRVLNLNPENPYAVDMQDEIELAIIFDDEFIPAEALPEDLEEIDRHIKRGDILVRQNDHEGALDEYITALEIKPDHDLALGKAIQYLVKLGYTDDARDLIKQALQTGTRKTSIFLTAMAFAQDMGKDNQVDILLRRIITLPKLEVRPIVHFLNRSIATGKLDAALKLAEASIEVQPKNQDLIVKLAQIQEQKGLNKESVHTYEKAAALGGGTAVGQIAAQKLESFIPVLTDKERGNVGLAWREVAGVGIFYFLMAWQDAGLNVAQMGFRRWMGVILAVAGSYLLITATSSPQQQPIATWLGGIIPHDRQEKDSEGNIIAEKTYIPIVPMSLRIMIGVIGVGMLIFGFLLVFSAALILIQDPVEPYIPPFDLMG